MVDSLVKRVEYYPSDRNILVADAFKQAEDACLRYGGHIADASEAIDLWLVDDVIGGVHQSTNLVTITQQIAGKTRGGSNVVLYLHGSKKLLGNSKTISDYVSRGLSNGGAVFDESDNCLFQDLVEGKHGLQVFKDGEMGEGFISTGEYGIVVPGERVINLPSGFQELSALEQNPHFRAMAGCPAKARQYVSGLRDAEFTESLARHAFGRDLVQRSAVARFVLRICHGNGLSGSSVLNYDDAQFVRIASETLVDLEDLERDV